MPSPWFCAAKTRVQGRPLNMVWILGSASRPQDDGGALSDRVQTPPHTQPMQAAPTFNDWKALRIAILALIAAGVTGQARAFLKAVREAKAAALVLLFALARSLWPEDETEKDWTPPKAPRLSPLGRGRPETDEDAWRNPPAVAFRMDMGRSASTPPKAEPNPQRLSQRVTDAFQVLQQILSLCDDPDAHAMRLRRRLDQVDAPLIMAEAKAFAVNAKAQAQARRNREARKLIDQTWRGRRRRESG